LTVFLKRKIVLGNEEPPKTVDYIARQESGTGIRQIKTGQLGDHPADLHTKELLLARLIIFAIYRSFV
jgi:hypothetical protein